MGDVNTTTEGNTPVSYTIDLDTVADVWSLCIKSNAINSAEAI